MATVYLISNTELGAIKIGIAGVGGDRLRSHQRRGWTVLHETEPILRDSAITIEQLILRGWRREGIRPSVLPEDMPQGGHTETASLMDLEVDEVVTRMRELFATHGQTRVSGAGAGTSVDVSETVNWHLSTRDCWVEYKPVFPEKPFTYFGPDSISEIASAVHSIVDSESPVHLDLVVERLSNYWELSLQDSVLLRLAIDHDIDDLSFDDKFLVNPHLLRIRPRIPTADAHRPSNQIHFDEYHSAIAVACGQPSEMPPIKEIFSEVSSLFELTSLPRDIEWRFLDSTLERLRLAFRSKGWCRLCKRPLYFDYPRSSKRVNGMCEFCSGAEGRT